MANLSIVNTLVTFNGHRVTGWADASDALMLPTITVTNAQRGADGGVVYSSTGVRGGPVTLKLLATSPSTAFFAGQAAIILNGGAVTFNGTIQYLDTGETVYCETGALSVVPTGHSLGNANPGTQEFTFEFARLNRVTQSVRTQ